MRNLYLIPFVAALSLGACTTDSGLVIKCTVKGETKEFTTGPGREDCDKIRATLPSANAVVVAETKKNDPAVFIAPAAPQNTPGFIEPTNKAQRQEEIKTKVSLPQRDPFAVIPGSVPPPPPAPRPPVQPIIKPNPSTLPISITKTEAPVVVPPPSTAEASAVFVSGILDIGGTRYAIINAPGEPTSRPISVGQTFVNGKVLFKQIDDTSGGTFVILVQNGVEVRRPIGRQVVAAAAPKPAPAPTLVPPTEVNKPAK